jgi:hypothetical protein
LSTAYISYSVPYTYYRIVYDGPDLLISHNLFHPNFLHFVQLDRALRSYVSRYRRRRGSRSPSSHLHAPKSSLPGQLSRSRPRARGHAQSIAGRQARAVTWEQCLAQYTTTGSNPKVQTFIVILTAFSIVCASVRAEVATPIPNNRNESYHGIRSRLPRRNIWRYSGGRHCFFCFSFPVWTIVATSTLVHAQLFAMISRLFACR